MTVKCLNQYQKQCIASTYVHSNTSLSDLAFQYNTSNRTIGRVLNEFGLSGPLTRIEEDAKKVMRILKQFDVSPDTLSEVLEMRQAMLRPRTKQQPVLLFTSAYA